MNVDILIPNLQLSAAALSALPKSATAAPAALAALLDKATRTEVKATAPGSFPWLLNAFNMPEDARNAGVSSLFVNAEICAGRLPQASADHVWLVAEPVYLKPDRDALALYRGAYLDITAAEAAAIITTLNQHFAQDGLLFAAATPPRWYVQCPVTSAPSSSAPSWIAARGELFTHMPVNAVGGINWRAILNEVQMLLFNHAVNTQREMAGKIPINGVWVFGGATAAAPPSKPPYQTVYSNGFETQALAGAYSLKCLEMPVNWVSIKFNEDCILTVDALESIAVEDDFLRWQQARESLNSGIFSPLFQKIESGEISCLRLIDAHTATTVVYTIAPFTLKRFFKNLFSGRSAS